MMNWTNSLQLKKIRVVLHYTKYCYLTRSTRQSSQLNIPRCYRAVGQRSFSYRRVKLCSGISDNVKSTDSVNMFKRRLVELLLCNQEPDCKKLVLFHSLFLYCNYYFYELLLLNPFSCIYLLNCLVIIRLVL